MTEQELNVFLDLEWNCAAFSSEESSVSAPLSPKQWACIISRHPELQELCPFSEFTLEITARRERKSYGGTENALDKSQRQGLLHL